VEIPCIASIPNHVILYLVSRWFCENCGAHLLCQRSVDPERIFVRAGTIEAFTKMPIVLEGECVECEVCDGTLELTSNIAWTKYRWPSIPAIPGALQMEEPTGAGAQAELSKLLKPFEAEQSA
jgi:hypothetical protein